MIPLQTSETLLRWIERAAVRVRPLRHWTQIEHSARFVRLVGDFLCEERWRRLKAAAVVRIVVRDRRAARATAGSVERRMD